VFLIGISFGATYGLLPYTNFFYQSTGLSIENGEVGAVQAVTLITMMVCILASGWLADRFHPIRVVIVGLIFQLVVALPLQMLWLVWTPDHATTYRLWMIIAVLVSGPAGAMIGMLDPPLFMRIFPHDRYGQYCSANALVRTAAIALFGLVYGLFFDRLRSASPDQATDATYLWMPVFLWFPYLLMLCFAILLYRSWKKHGGDAAYHPPTLKL
jgi:MFS family permease